MHETALGHKGQGDREQKRSDSQLIYAAVVPEVARGLFLIHVRLKKAGPLSVLHMAQTKHRGESLGCILQNLQGVKKTQNIRGGKEIHPPSPSTPCVHTHTETLGGCTTPFLEGGGLHPPEPQRAEFVAWKELCPGRITFFHFLPLSAAPVGGPRPPPRCPRTRRGGGDPQHSTAQPGRASPRLRAPPHRAAEGTRASGRDPAAAMANACLPRAGETGRGARAEAHPCRPGGSSIQAALRGSPQSRYETLLLLGTIWRCGARGTRPRRGAREEGRGFTALRDLVHLGTGCTPKPPAINTLAQPAQFLT